MLPRVSWEKKLSDTIYEIELADWSDARFATHVMVIWSDENGVYCLAETAHCLDDYSQLLFPGFSTTCFEEMAYQDMKGAN